MFSRYKKNLEENHDVEKMTILTGTFLRMLHFIISQKKNVSSLDEFINNQEVSKQINEIPHDTLKIMEVYLIVVFGRIVARIKSNKIDLIEVIPAIDNYFDDTSSAMNAIAIILNWGKGSINDQKINIRYINEIVSYFSQNNKAGLEKIRDIADNNNFGTYTILNKIIRGSMWISVAHHAPDYLLCNDTSYIKPMVKSALSYKIDDQVVELITNNLTNDIDAYINLNIIASEELWKIIPRKEKEMALELSSQKICSIISFINDNRKYPFNLNYRGYI